jgi:hypothetical protein
MATFQNVMLIAMLWLLPDIYMLLLNPDLLMLQMMAKTL